MAVFHVYAIGDSQFLAEVMGAAASVFGYSGYTDLIKVGMLLGVLIVAFKTLINQKFELHQLLVVFILYGLFFQNTDTETYIHDELSGGTIKVDNLPIGFAGTASLVSTASSQLTKIFETAYTTVGISTGGYLRLPKLLLDSRKIGLGDANSAGGGDIERTLLNYLTDCTFTSIDMGMGITKEDIMTSSDIITDMFFDSSVYTTKQFMPGDSEAGVIRYCGTPASGGPSSENGYEVIKNYVDNDLEAPWADVIKSKLGIATPFGAGGEIQEALDNLVISSSVDAYGYMKQALMKTIMARAATYDALTYTDAVAAITETEASEQRNFQWAMEQSMFMRIMMPMMTFIESLVYAITPLAAFLMMLGTPGIMLAAKYLYLLVWVALWKPIIAIVNLYATMKMEGALTNYETFYDLNSMNGMTYLENGLAEWIGVAGMLTASTPAIALMLIYGSSVTATHLASRMQGADHIDEKNASPDITKNNAMVTNMGHGSITPAYGYNEHDSLKSISGATIDQGTISSMVSSANSFKTGKSNQLTASRTELFQSLNKIGNSASEGAGLSTSTTGSGSQTFKTTSDWAENLNNSHGFSSNSTSAIQMGIHAGLGGDLESAKRYAEQAVLSDTNKTKGGKGKSKQNVLQDTQSGKGGLNTGMDISGTKTMTDGQKADYNKLVSEMMGYGRSHSSDLQNSVRSDLNSGRLESFSNEETASDAHAYLDAATELKSAEQTYQSTEQLARSFGSGWSGSANELFNKQQKENPEALQQLTALSNRDGVRSRFNEHMANFNRTGQFGGKENMKTGTAANLAIMEAIAEGGSTIYSGLMSDYASVNRQPSISNVNPESNSGLQGQNVVGPTDSHAGERGRVARTVGDETISSVADSNTSNIGRANKSFNDNKVNVVNTAMDNGNEMFDAAREGFSARTHLNQSDDITNSVFNHMQSALTNIGNIGAVPTTAIGKWAYDSVFGDGSGFNAAYSSVTEEGYHEKMNEWTAYQTESGGSLTDSQVNYLASVESGRFGTAITEYSGMSSEERTEVNTLHRTDEIGKEWNAAINGVDNTADNVRRVLQAEPHVNVEIESLAPNLIRS